MRILGSQAYVKVHHAFKQRPFCFKHLVFHVAGHPSVLYRSHSACSLVGPPRGTQETINMDFAAFMSAQISKSKSAAPPTPPASDSMCTTTTSKYLSRREIEEQRERDYLASQARLDAERQERLAKKRKADDEEAERNAAREEKKRRLAADSALRREEDAKRDEGRRRKRLGLPSLPDPKEENTPTEASDSAEDIPEDELRSRLRAVGEPATLFDESHGARLSRWRMLNEKAVARKKLSSGPIPTTLEPVPEADMLVPTKTPNDTAARTFLFRQLASYFTLVLSEWSLALAQRDPETKESYSGRAAYSAMVTARTNMIPLFRKFETGDLEPGVLDPVVEIVRAAQERRYVDANDGYLRLSIGKAAWPIGVTMVGIHERSAREKLHESDKQAHIMSDEVTRKFLQSIKRCLSFAQTRWPPEDMGQLMG